jgi:uncharacterized protein YciI
MRYFVYLLRIVVDRATYEPHLPEHLAYLDQLDAAGILALSGPFGDRTGGIIVIRAASMDTARAIAEADPLVASGVDEYELREWRLTGGNTSRIRIERPFG